MALYAAPAKSLHMPLLQQHHWWSSRCHGMRAILAIIAPVAQRSHEHIVFAGLTGITGIIGATGLTGVSFRLHVTSLMWMPDLCAPANSFKPGLSSFVYEVPHCVTLVLLPSMLSMLYLQV